MSGGSKMTSTNEGGSAMLGMPGTSASATPPIANTIGPASPETSADGGRRGNDCEETKNEPGVGHRLVDQTCGMNAAVSTRGMPD